ncbi:uncharacterized protein LOC124675920 [Lolium rigidum]|uniref:uncharacterized protein LOC124675920 n=1 Tax=Lolium rigidum TaxID=89674 RepID=UPI001F5C689A|nr:uncharacterized protein LOC124675920 [Lolium rigidum]
MNFSLASTLASVVFKRPFPPPSMANRIGALLPRRPREPNEASISEAGQEICFSRTSSPSTGSVRRSTAATSVTRAPSRPRRQAKGPGWSPRSFPRQRHCRHHSKAIRLTCCVWLTATNADYSVALQVGVPDNSWKLSSARGGGWLAPLSLSRQPKCALFLVPCIL